MSTPKTKVEFKNYCLRKLGKPVIEINVDEDQVDDRVDEALKYYWDYHFDGSDKQYYKYVFQAEDFPDKLKEVVIHDGGTGYSNTDTVTISAAPGDAEGHGATASLTTDSTGKITSINVTNIGEYYRLDPVVSITSGTGSGASLTAYKGGYVTMPENIMGVVRIFDIGNYISSGNFFNIKYQIALNDLYTLTYQSMVPYYMAMQHLQFIEQLLVGSQPVRFNRHTNRLYLDMGWEKVSPGQYLIVEAYEIIDPVKFPDVWGDRWLGRYATALIKKQWGNNLKKFSGIQMPGGVTFNGQQIYDEAEEEIKELEAEMINSFSLPVYDMIG